MNNSQKSLLVDFKSLKNVDKSPIVDYTEYGG